MGDGLGGLAAAPSGAPGLLQAEGAWELAEPDGLQVLGKGRLRPHSWPPYFPAARNEDAAF